MCSIPGLPTPGSEVPVLIRRVNLNSGFGLVELWVNMDDGRKHIHDQMREDIQIPDRKFYGSEGKPGDLCLVRIGGTWHRARIVAIQNESYNVFLIDQGQSHVTTSEALAWGQSDSFLLPPEIESCILANVLSPEKNWPERVTKFLKSLPGKKFKGLVQHVLMPDRTILLDIPIVSKYIFKIGNAKKMPADEFKIIATECLNLLKREPSDVSHKMKEQALIIEKPDQYFYPELLTGTSEAIIITEVIDPHKIFCKLLILSKAIEILYNQIHQHYEENPDLGEAQPQTCGDPCAARGNDGRWHRSLLKQNMTADGVVAVLHVDDGKTEFVPVRDIKPLHGKFLRLPVVTYPCSLYGVKDNGTGWTTDQTDYLKSLLFNQIVCVRFDHHSVPQDVYDITVFADDDSCINDCFIEQMGHSPSLNVQNELIPSSYLKSLGDERLMDLENKPKTENLADNEKKNVSTSGTNDTDIKETSEHPDPLLPSNRHLSKGFPYEVQNAHDDVFTVGSHVNVKISCIEGLDKFWCQTENDDSLRLLMQGLQNYYASAHPEPLVESICIARNPDNGMWYRARIITGPHSPAVDVRFIDYGLTQKVPLQDVCSIDPTFLRLKAQAFQCCLFNLNNPSAVTQDDPALAKIQKFMDLGASSDIVLECIVKGFDEEGLLLNVVDIETPPDAGCKDVAQKRAQAQAPLQSPPQVPSDTYVYSTHNIGVGEKEKVLVTSSKNVNHFYCRLERNSHLFEKMMENVKQLIGQAQCTDNPLGLNSICFARYSDNQWYRGELVEMTPKPTVHFVDHGHTLMVNESDICPFPTEASIARSIPVQGVELALFSVPAEVPQEVNLWFADRTVGHSLTISVVAKEEKGKLIVELFDGSLNINMAVRERMSKITQQNMAHLDQQSSQQLSNSSKHGCVPDQDCLTEDLTNTSAEENKASSNNGMCARDEVEMSSQSIITASAPETEHCKSLDKDDKPTVDLSRSKKEIVLAEDFIQDGCNESEMAQLSLPPCSEGNGIICGYKRFNIAQNKTVEVYASCIAGPYYFWCQYANTEELDKVSRLAQEAGQAELDVMFSKTLGPGSPCLALFSSDNQWYRAQVVHRTDNALNVVFIDYGNESEVEIENVRPLPQGLLEKAPQAFLCSLNGFVESEGSWDDSVYDDLYTLLVDKPLKLTVFDMEDNSEIAVPHFAVQIECENVIVNDALQKYWKPVAPEDVLTESLQAENLLQDVQTEPNMTHICVSKEISNISTYKNPNLSRNKQEEVYASCIVEPHFFWCQYANTEELNKISRLAQEAGQAKQDTMFPETLGPGSPCLALFSSDEQWYRAQVINRVDSMFHVVFIDYGNESDVHIKNVKPLTQDLLDQAPQAFLCSLNVFDKSGGSWDDKVYEDFYNYLVDKPLKMTVFNMSNHPELVVPQFAVRIEYENMVVNEMMQEYWKPVAIEHVTTESHETENLPQDEQTQSNMTNLSVSEETVHKLMYRKPNVSKNKTEEVYASCIVEPHFFWCQYANTEELDKISTLAQEAGQAKQDTMFPETLGPGSPCLALFSSDEQWYRAQVIQRTDDTFHVVFIDYGNESDVHINNVRPLHQSLLDQAPLAFLCSLNGFDKSKGTWDDSIYDDFYNLLVDKPLKMTAFNMVEHSEIAAPQYAVQIECEGVIVNTLMEKYWKEVDTDHASA